MSYEHITTVEPDQGSGKPCIRGLRVTVQDVPESLASGMTEDEIPADFSELRQGVAEIERGERIPIEEITRELPSWVIR